MNKQETTESTDAVLAPNSSESEPIREEAPLESKTSCRNLESVLAAIGLAGGIGALIGLWVSYQVSMANWFTTGQWFQAALVMAGAYLIFTIIAGFVAFLFGSFHIAMFRILGRPSVGWHPVIDILGMTAAMMTFGIAGRLLQTVIMGETTIFALRCGVSLIAYLITYLVFVKRNFKIIRHARPTIGPTLISVGIIGYSVAAIWHGGRTTDQTQRGIQQFANATGGQTANERRLLLIGLDGASWDIVDAMIKRDELPALAKLAERGVAGPIETFVPTRSPLIWNTIATGAPPEEHGIENFVAFDIAGMTKPIIKWPRGVGFYSMLKAGTKCGLARYGPVSSANSRLPRMWDILAAATARSAVVGWWATSPVSNINGVVVSDTFYYERNAARYAAEQTQAASSQTVSPAILAPEFDKLRVASDHISSEEIRSFMNVTDEDIKMMREGEGDRNLVDSEFLFLYSMDKTYCNIANRILTSDKDLKFLAVYLRGIDISCHSALEYGHPLRENLKPNKYGDVVLEYYKHSDDLVAQLIQSAGPETTVVIVSDHGFEFQPNGKWGHDHAPDGIFIAAGDPFKEDQLVSGMSVYDILPTVLYLYDMAVPKDLKGKPALHLLKRQHVAENPAYPIDSYGMAAFTKESEARVGSEDEAVERLRTLGYVE